MIVRIDFELDDEALAILREAALARSQDEFAFVDAVQRFLDGDSFYDSVFNALAAAAQIDEPEG